MKVKMHNQTSNKTKSVPTGFSWTTMLFSGFPALFRGDFGYAIMIFVSSCLSGYIVGNFGWALFYNDLHYKKLEENGYVGVEQ